MFLKKSYKNPTLLIDGDLYLYRATTSIEEEVDWGNDIWTLYTDVAAAKRLFISMIAGFKSALKVHDVVVTFSGRNNFRRGVEPTYKAGRKKTRKPVGYAAMVEWALKEFDSILVDELEADDVMGVLGSIEGTKAIIVSDDKDMKSIPAKLFRPQSNERLDTTLAEADRCFLLQTLTGDVTDGYAGLKGVGPKSAEKILGARPTWGAVVAAYEKQELTEDYALTQARLARILRSSDWDDKKQSVILWEPPK
jgi:DNA polymerase-1|tara:strand:- start:89 stop:841 length:753 start_codon:yes stop_codon:yes gene_type:complete